jgi:pyruvate kinase
MDFTIIVTVGPGLLEKNKIKKIDSLGNCIFRINGAHADGEQTRNITNTIRGFSPDAKIMIDLPGNKVRTKNLTEPLRLSKGEELILQEYQVNYTNFYQHLKAGDTIYANDSIFTLEVVKIVGNTVQLLSHSDGLLQTNKGLHVQGIHAEIPFLFERDQELIDVACEIDLDVISLSFVRTADDIKVVKNILKEKNNTSTELFAKIETAAALDNLGYIFQEVETVNVDRGDLSTDIGILKLPSAVERITTSALMSGRNIFLATQFLKNMETSPVPLIAELSDIHNSVKSGISGIQLSEETAVGKFPVECVKLVFDLYHSSLRA